MKNMRCHNILNPCYRWIQGALSFQLCQLCFVVFFIFFPNIAFCEDVVEHVGSWTIERTQWNDVSGQGVQHCILGKQIGQSRYFELTVGAMTGMTLSLQDSSWSLPLHQDYNIVFGAPSGRWQITGSTSNDHTWVSYLDGDEAQSMIDHFESGISDLHIHYGSLLGNDQNMAEDDVTDMPELVRALPRLWSCMKTLDYQGAQIYTSQRDFLNHEKGVSQEGN